MALIPGYREQPPVSADIPDATSGPHGLLPLPVIRAWLARYEVAVAYLASNGTTVPGRHAALRERELSRAIMSDHLRDALAHADALTAQRDALLTALKGLMADIDSGLLVRDVARDGEAGWAIQMLGFVQRLHTAKAALASVTGQGAS